jgi:DNA adenine methylase
MIRAKPFLKWAGGKGQLIEAIRDALPGNFAMRKNIDYIEPFVGGGAVLFWMLENYMNIKNAVINDINADLMNAYRIIRQDPEKLIHLLNQFQEEYYMLKNTNDRKKYYHEKRDEFNLRKSDELISAGLMIFLNKTCYNGLYRVNTKNKFNVPFGRYENPRICDARTINACSRLLQKVNILHGDFSETLKYADQHSFFYFDPPYKPVSQTSSFTSYAAVSFSNDDQERLAGFCKQLHEIKIQWLLSNSCLKKKREGKNYFETLYNDFRIKRVKARRNINSVSSKRGKIFELLISNY